MKKVIMFVIVVTFYILKRRESIKEVVKFVREEGTFYFRNNQKGRAAARKLRRIPGFEFATIILTFDHGTGMKLERGKVPVFVLMGLPNPDASVEAYMVIPANHGKAVTKLNDIIASCTGNEYVSILIADLDAASVLVEKYNKAHGAARKVTLDLAVAAIEVFMAEFQSLADLPANKANSIVIIQSGGFHVKGVGGGHPSTWDAFSGKLSGEVMMTFITGKGTCCYDVLYSLDNINWIRVLPSIYNYYTLEGMVPNSDIYVKYQLVDSHGPEGFHPSIKVHVPA